MLQSISSLPMIISLMTLMIGSRVHCARKFDNSHFRVNLIFVWVFFPLASVTYHLFYKSETLLT